MDDKLIIVVEDDPLLRMDTTARFEEEGLHAEDFASADDAMAFVSVHADRIAAVFTDVNMPGKIDGLELARSVVAAWPHIVVVVNSGRTEQPANFPDAIRFLPKPWRLADVLPMMHQATDPRGGA